MEIIENELNCKIYDNNTKVVDLQKIFADGINKFDNFESIKEFILKLKHPLLLNDSESSFNSKIYKKCDLRKGFIWSNNKFLLIIIIKKIFYRYGIVFYVENEENYNKVKKYLEFNFE